MDIRQLTYFLGNIDYGGFGKAAEALHVAQPSLSQSIRVLERRLGVELFHRTGRGAELTSAGERLVLPARQVLRGIFRARIGIRHGQCHCYAQPRRRASDRAYHGIPRALSRHDGQR